MSTQRFALQAIWRRVAPARMRSVLAVLLASLSLACAIGLIATSAWLISRASQQPPILYLTVAVVAVRAFGIGRGVFRYVERLVSHSAALSGLTNLRVELVSAIARVSPGGVRWLRPGDAVRRLVDDVDGVSEFGLRTLYPSWTAGVVGLGVVGLVAWLVPAAGLVLLVGLLVAGIAAPWITHRVSRHAAEVEVSVMADLAATTAWVFGNAETISASGRGEDAMGEVRNLNDQLLASDSEKSRGLGLSAGLAMLAQGVALVGVILVAVPAVTSGALNGVNLAVVILIPLVAFEVVAPLPGAAIARARATRGAQRVDEVLEAKDPVRSVVSSPDAPTQAVGEIRVEHVSAMWPDAKALAVADVSFHVPAGGELTVTGASGAGKSTLAAALVKFLDAQGTISLDGVDYGHMSGDAVRRNVILSEQDPYIFDNSIAANIQFADPSASEGRIEEVVAQAELGEWVASLPDGIATALGEHGAQVSGGQRQRIALARALLSTAPVVLFDEPTEHLDRDTAAALMASIRRVLADRTVIVFTHDADVIDTSPHVVRL